MKSAESSSIPRAFHLIAICGAFLTVAAIIWATRSYTQPAPVDKTRAEERRKANIELKQAAREKLLGYQVLDPSKGLIRMPIERAMEIAVEELRTPSAVRSNLAARVSHFHPPPPPPPPKAPEKPSEFE